MSASNYAETRVLDAILGTGHAAGFPSTVYVGLSTTTIADAGTVTEPGAGSYARVSVTNNDTNWPAATSVSNVGTKSNGTAITFPAPTANWGTVTDFFIADASTAGNVLLYGVLTSSHVVNNADAAPSFAIGALTITAD